MASIQYIHELKNWPAFQWDPVALSEVLSGVCHRQGRLLGRMEALGFHLQSEAVLQAITEEVMKTSEIEGERLNREQVRSSIAQRLNIPVAGVSRVDRHVEGIVELMLDATQNYRNLLTVDRLFAWHAALFPTGRSGMLKIQVGQWRNDSQGPMQVVSGALGKEKIHFKGPSAERLNHEMQLFLTWFNQDHSMEAIVKAAIAHLWFVTIHPFEDGNGRIARAIADMTLARSEGSSQRFYSMSSQICAERKDYYDILELTQRGDLEITHWLQWFLTCLDRAVLGSEVILESVLKKSRFWVRHEHQKLNARQRNVLSRLLDGFVGKLTSSKWAKINKCSQDTASRDIESLVSAGVLIRNPEGGRSTSYSLRE